MAAGLALTAAAFAASGLGGGEGTAAVPDASPEPGRRSVQLVSAPVRIADAATVRLLRPGDRVDLIAADATGSGARVVAKDVRVTRVPRSTADGPGPAAPGEGTGAQGGALVVVSVERATAAALAGAGVSGRLAVAVSHGH